MEPPAIAVPSGKLQSLYASRAELPCHVPVPKSVPKIAAEFLGTSRISGNRKNARNAHKHWINEPAGNIPSQYSGTYDIRRGERLSELLARAGGLTAQAYPYGAVFTRESVRQRQQEGFQRTARELETSLIQVAAGQAVAGSRAANLDVGGAINAGQALAGTLREARAAGRMVVEANPVVLASRPQLDVLLEPGDLVVVPKRPNEVTVVGAVLNPGSLQFASGWRASQYVLAAGGEQRFADASRAFVVLPNGQSVPAGLGSWQAGGPPIPPGSLVVVPQDPSPYETWGFIRDLASVLGQISISSAALAVIARQGR